MFFCDRNIMKPHSASPAGFWVFLQSRTFGGVFRFFDRDLPGIAYHLLFTVPDTLS